MEPWLIIGGTVVMMFLYAIFGDKNADYPPKDEKGRPMKACFGTRGTSFRWVRQADD